jgi:hypothetical protein
MTSEQLLSIRDEHDSWLRSLPGVVGTGVGLDRSGRIALKVFSNQIPAETRRAIAARLGDVPLAIEETGEIRKQTY